MVSNLFRSASNLAEFFLIISFIEFKLFLKFFFRSDLYYYKTDKAKRDFQDGMLLIMMRKGKR